MMGQKFIPHEIIWDEVCTVPRPTLETFLDWLEGRGVQVICCSDQGQPPPIAGEMPHDWLLERLRTNGFYEEVEVDHRAKDPLLKALKKAIRLQPDRVQCREVRKALPGCLPGSASWRPGSRVISSWPRGRRFATGPRGCCSSAMRSISRTPPYLYYTARKTLGGKTSWSPSLGPCCCGTMRIMGQSS